MIDNTAESTRRAKSVSPVRGTQQTSFAARMAAIHVPHTRFKEAVNAITAAIQYAGSMKEVPCLVLSGPSGVGKTTLIDTLAATYPSLPWEDSEPDADPDVPRVRAARMPLLTADMPTDPTPISVCKALLEASGDEDFDQGRKFSLERRLDRIVTASGTCAVLLDEGQRLVDRGTLREGQAILDWMKDRHAATQVIFVLVGLGRIKDVLGDAQLKRRYDKPLRLLPYEWRTDDPTSDDRDRAEFLGFLRSVRMKSPLGFAPDVDITQPNADVLTTGKRFFCASQGRPALLMKLLIKVARRVDAGLTPPLVTFDELGLAFEEAIGESADWQNPFSRGWNGSMCPPVEDDFAPADAFCAVPRRPRRRQKSRSQRSAEARNALVKR